MSDVRVDYSELRAVRQAVESLSHMQVAIAQELQVVQTRQADTDQRLRNLADMFAAFVDADRKAKELHLAETRLVKVRQEVETSYGHYGDVRRRATGILQALDAGIVTHETIQETTEDVMMAAPRYWLAPALVALASWSRDDRPLAEKALAEALSRDADKSSLFFGLVLRRYRRRQAVASWLAHFFERQDPRALRREFVVVLDGIATGAFGPEAKASTSTIIDRWLRDLEAGAGFADVQRTRWQNALVALTPVVDDGEFPHLSVVSTTWPQLKANLAAARRNRLVIQHFQAIFADELEVPSQLRVQIDAMLDDLVSRFDEEELPLRRQEAELQAIVDAGGDRDAALAKIASVERALEELVDFPTLLTNAAMHAEESGASRGTQRLAVAMSRDWILSAHDSLTAATRSAAPAAVELQLVGWTGTISEGDPEQPLLDGLGAHIDAETEAAVSDIRFGGGHLAAAIGAPLVLALIAAFPGAVVVLLLVAIGLGLYAFMGYRGLDGKRAAVRQAGEERKRQALEELKATLVELVDYREIWRTADADATKAHELLDAISPEQYELRRADDARMVLT